MKYSVAPAKFLAKSLIAASRFLKQEQSINQITNLLITKFTTRAVGLLSFLETNKTARLVDLVFHKSFGV